MTQDQFDEAFDRGEYESEYSQWLFDHHDCNALCLQHLAENFESYEDFRNLILEAA